MEEQWNTPTGEQDVITKTTVEQTSEPESQQEITALAYELWQARGCPEGTPEEDWFRAEEEIAGSEGMVQKTSH